MALRNPVLPKNVVLMSPGSELQLKTNRDFASGARVAYSVAKPALDGNVATVDNNGLVVAGQVCRMFSFLQFFLIYFLFLSSHLLLLFWQQIKVTICAKLKYLEKDSQIIRHFYSKI
jgi:hypothetical protein